MESRKRSRSTEEGEETYASNANQFGTAEASGGEILIPTTEEEKREALRLEEIARRAEERVAARMIAATATACKISDTVDSTNVTSTTRDHGIKPQVTSAETETINKPIFLTKAEREAAALQRLNTKRADKDLRDHDMENAHERFATGRAQQERISLEQQRKTEIELEKIKRQDFDHKDMKERNSELRAIQEQYLGGAEVSSRHSRIVANSKKGGKTFKMEWDDTEDTSRKDFNPLYSQRFQSSVLFGRGNIGGIDPRELRKNSTFLLALGDKRMSEVREAERANADISDNEKRLRERQREDAAKAMRKSQATALTAYDEAASRAIGFHWSEKPLDMMTERDWRIFREDFDIRVQGGQAVAPLRNWTEAAFPESIMRAINSLGYKSPSPIQRQAIPVGLARRDIMGIAETGSGKTCAFLVPLLCYILSLPSAQTKQQAVAENGPLGVIMAPTRELAQQIDEEAAKLSRFTNFIESFCVVGGQDIEVQGVRLRKGVHIVVGTPGRLVDCLASNYLVLNQCTYIVLDEADRMVDMGFEDALTTVLDAMGGLMKSENEEQAMHQAEQALKGLSSVRVTAMFSATMSPEVERIAKRYLRHPAIIKIGDQDSGKNKRIDQRIIWLSEGQKRARLADLMRQLGKEEKAIVFVNAKKQADSVGWALEQSGFDLGILHGGKTQTEREDTLEAFRRGQFKILVATDVAARGLDIPDVSHVINYDCPLKIENYSHRIGRTGRAGKTGISITFLTDSDTDIMFDLKSYLESTNCTVPDQLKRHPAAQQPVGTRNEAGKLLGERNPRE